MMIEQSILERVEATKRRNALIDAVSQRAVPDTACGCIGPQNGQPLCPCAMRGVIVRNGRYVRETDLGPAPLGMTLP